MLVIPTRVRVVLVVSALTFAAGLLSLALLAKPAQAEAETSRINERLHIGPVPVENPCTGDVVIVEGTLHIVGHDTIDADGGVHFVVHNEFQGSGVSESGAEYVVSGVHNTHHVGRLDSAFNFTIEDTFNVIRQGSHTSEDNFRIRLVTHLTINANGEVTSEFVKAEPECPGEEE
jgi:hypothetical protein